MIKPQRPSSFSRTLALMPPLMVLTVQVAEAGTYIKIGDGAGSNTIPGEAKEVTHLNWIDAKTFQFGVTTSTTLALGGIQAGKAVGSDLVVTKNLDKSSPKLFLSCAQGVIQPKVTLELTQKTGVDQEEVLFYRITLTNVIVSSLVTAGITVGERPTESVSFSYQKITTEYYAPDSKGAFPPSPTSTSTWDFVTNSPK
jgi:type VI secretion system secreted protein Hcp